MYVNKNAVDLSDPLWFRSAHILWAAYPDFKDLKMSTNTTTT